MPYDLQTRLVIGVASSAMFNLQEADEVFRTKGEEEYRKYQSKNIDNPLEKGVSFSLIKRLLSLNNLSQNPETDPLIEVVLLSRNDPDTGLRVMKSIEHYNLPISRAIFMQGKSPYEYIPALNISLFLSGNSEDVKEAIRLKYPAGYVMQSAIVDEANDNDLRIAFDFDGVLADDESETVMHETKDLRKFHQHEILNVLQPHNPGPLKEFLVKISAIQQIETQKKLTDPNYKNRIRVSIVTARNAPSHERAINTLKQWGVITNDAFFLGGVDKGLVLGVLKPHIFFDDQSGHLNSTSSVAPSVHIPFGIKNTEQ
ncbi:5'-nucleotidase [Providencia sp.]|uniref:5'-nucleotidase n=1 Tax=Providencia sp. TaxID=589 RepID=UPI0035AFFCBA